MKNYVDVYYKERSGKVRSSYTRDSLHGGEMGDKTCRSHGAICDLQEEICLIEECYDIAFKLVKNLCVDYAIKVLEEYKNVPNDILNCIEEYIKNIKYPIKKRKNNSKSSKDIKEDIRKNIVNNNNRAEYHKWLRKREEQVIDMVEDMCDFDKYYSGISYEESDKESDEENE